MLGEIPANPSLGFFYSWFNCLACLLLQVVLGMRRNKLHPDLDHSFYLLVLRGRSAQTIQHRHTR